MDQFAGALDSGTWDDNGNGLIYDPEVVAAFVYELNLDDSRKKVTETEDQGPVQLVDRDGVQRVVALAVARLAGQPGLLDHRDLVGNRFTKLSDTDPAAGDLAAFRNNGTLAADKTVTYDENDRLLTEVKDADDTHTAYEYGPTDQRKTASCAKILSFQTPGACTTCTAI